MTPFTQGLWVQCQHWRSNERLTTWPPFTPVKISWASCFSRKIWNRRKIGPWAEQLVIVKQSKTEVLSSARQEQEWQLFPFLHWYGRNKMRGEFVGVKRKKKKSEFSFFVSFLKTKKIKTRVSRPEHFYFVFCFVLFCFVFFGCSYLCMSVT